MLDNNSSLEALQRKAEIGPSFTGLGEIFASEYAGSFRCLLAGSLRSVVPASTIKRGINIDLRVDVERSLRAQVIASKSQNSLQDDEDGATITNSSNMTLMISLVEKPILDDTEPAWIFEEKPTILDLVPKPVKSWRAEQLRERVGSRTNSRFAKQLVKKSSVQSAAAVANIRMMEKPVHDDADGTMIFEEKPKLKNPFSRKEMKTIREQLNKRMAKYFASHPVEMCDVNATKISPHFVKFVEAHNRNVEKFQQLLGPGELYPNHYSFLKSIIVGVSANVVKSDLTQLLSCMINNARYGTYLFGSQVFEGYSNSSDEKPTFTWTEMALNNLSMKKMNRRRVNPLFIASHNRNVDQMAKLIEAPFEIPKKFNILTPRRENELRKTDTLIRDAFHLKMLVNECTSRLWRRTLESFRLGKLFPALIEGLPMYEVPYMYVGSEYSTEAEQFWMQSRQKYCLSSWLADQSVSTISSSSVISQALIFAFTHDLPVGSDERCHLIRICFPGDSCTAKFDFHHGVVTIQCKRFSESLEEVIKLPNSLVVKNDKSQPNLTLQLASKEITSHDGGNGIILRKLKAEKSNPIVRRWIQHTGSTQRIGFDQAFTNVVSSTSPTVQKKSFRKRKWYGLDDRLHGWQANNEFLNALKSFDVGYALRRSKSEVPFRVWRSKSGFKNLLSGDVFEKSAHCVHYDDLAEFRKLLTENKQLATQSSKFGDTLLHISCALGRFEHAKLLNQLLPTELTAPLLWEDKNSKTPLTKAFQNKQIALLYSVFSDPEFRIDMLYHDRCLRNFLHQAFDYGCFEESLIYLLLDNGVPSDDVDSRFRTSVLCILEYYSRLRAGKVKENVWFMQPLLVRLLNERFRLIFHTDVVSSHDIYFLVDLRTLALKKLVRFLQMMLWIRKKDAVWRKTYNWSVIISGQSLRVWCWRDIGLHDAGIIFALSCIAQQPQQFLDLRFSHNSLSDKCMEFFGFLFEHKTVVNFCVSHNSEVTDDGIKFLTQAITKKCALRRLDLDYTSIGGNGLACLALKLHDCDVRLKILKLMGLKITQQATAALGQFIEESKSLSSVDFSFCSFRDPPPPAQNDNDEALTSSMTPSALDSLLFGIKRNSSLRSVSLDDVDADSNEIIAIVSCFGRHAFIRKLKLWLKIADVNDEIKISELMHENYVLQFLKVKHSSDKAVREAYARAVYKNPGNLTYFEGIDLSCEECVAIHGFDKERHWYERTRWDYNKRVLNFLRKTRHEDNFNVRRACLMFVGNEKSGKTSLIRRLKENIFNDSNYQSEFIEFSSMVLQDIELKVFDFGGRSEFEHSQPVFFNNSAIFILVHNRASGDLNKLKRKLDMVLNAAPKANILLVLTRADESVLTDEERRTIEAWKNIKSCIHVDTKSSRGIDQLKEAIVSLSCGLSTTIKSVSPSIERLKIITSRLQHRFTMTRSEIDALCTKSLHMTTSEVDLALELFVAWGCNVRLSNGDIVVDPQQLAKIMGGVFLKPETTNPQNAIISHTNEAMDAIFLPLCPTMSAGCWHNKKDATAPVLDVLHQSHLAFPASDEAGQPLDHSVVPALLPVNPQGMESFETFNEYQKTQPVSETLQTYNDNLCQKFFPGESEQQPSVRVSFDSPIPSSFMGHMQAQLRLVLVLNGTWKTGCCISLKDEDGQSMAIMHQPTDHSLHFLSGGVDTAARTVAVATVIKAMDDSFPTMRIDDVMMSHAGYEYSKSDIIKGLDKGYVINPLTQEHLSVGRLRILFPEESKKRLSRAASKLINARELAVGSQVSDTNVSLTASRLASAALSYSLRDSVNAETLDCAPTVVKDSLTDLEVLVEQLECDRQVLLENGTDVRNKTDNVELSDFLLASLPALHEIMGLNVTTTKRLSTIWIVVGQPNLDKCFAVPISPVLVKGNVTWRPLLKEARIDVSEAFSQQAMEMAHFGEPWRLWLSCVAAALIERVFKLLGVSLGNWQIRPFVVLTPWQQDIREKETTLFKKVEGVHIMNKEACAQAALMEEPIVLTEKKESSEELLDDVVAKLQSDFAGVSADLHMVGQSSLIDELNTNVSTSFVVLDNIVVGGSLSPMEVSAAIDLNLQHMDEYLESKLRPLNIDYSEIRKSLVLIHKRLKRANEVRRLTIGSSTDSMAAILNALRKVRVESLPAIQNESSYVSLPPAEDPEPDYNEDDYYLETPSLSGDEEEI